MSGAVKEVLRETFLKNNGSKDVQTLAAERIAISLLDIGFNELRRFSQKTEQEVKNQPNPGL